MSEKHVVASQVHKGQFVRVSCSTQGFCWVRVTKREKWSATRTKLHFEDCGYGLPTAQFGTEHLSMKEDMFDFSQPVVVRTALLTI